METNSSEILVMGVGGAGCNALRYLIENAVYNMAFMAVNTDSQSLASFKTGAMLIGENTTFGRGTGGDPELGRKAAEENIDDIRRLFVGKNLLILLVGLGGGTGTGATQVIAEEAKKNDLLTLVFATMPFSYEGDYRSKVAKEGLARLRESASSVLILSNDKINKLNENDASFAKSLFAPFRYIYSSLNALREIVMLPGIINLDYADLRAVLAKPCLCHIGFGEANGIDRVSLALQKATACDLFDFRFEKTENVIIYLVGNQENFKSSEAEAAMNGLKKMISPSARIYFGINYNSELGDHVRILIVASYTGNTKSNGESSSLNFSKESSADQYVPAFIRKIKGDN